MSDSGINLLRSKHSATLTDSKKVKQVLRVVSFGLLGVVALLAVGVYVLAASSKLPVLAREEGEITAAITKDKVRLGQLFFVRDQSISIKDVIGKRANLAEKVSEVKKIVPSDLSVSSLQIDKQSVSLSVVASSLLPLETLIDSLSDMVATKKLFKKVHVSGISVDLKNQTYATSIRAEFL